MFQKKKSVYDYIFPAPLPSYTEKQPSLIIIETKNDKIPCMFFPMSTEEGSRKLNPKRQICLYYHGNGEDIGHNYMLLKQIQGKIKVFFVFFK